jgi:hypothetical protein
MPGAPHFASTCPADVGIGQSLNWIEHERRLHVAPLQTPLKSNDSGVAVEEVQPSVVQHLQIQRVPALL